MRLQRSICAVAAFRYSFLPDRAWCDVIDDHGAFEETLDGALLDLQGGPVVTEDFARG